MLGATVDDGKGATPKVHLLTVRNRLIRPSELSLEDDIGSRILRQDSSRLVSASTAAKAKALHSWLFNFGDDVTMSECSTSLFENSLPPARRKHRHCG
jgi:hypothetical protein